MAKKKKAKKEAAKQEEKASGKQLILKKGESPLDYARRVNPSHPKIKKSKDETESN